MSGGNGRKNRIRRPAGPRPASRCRVLTHRLTRGSCSRSQWPAWPRRGAPVDPVHSPGRRQPVGSRYWFGFRRLIIRRARPHLASTRQGTMSVPSVCGRLHLLCPGRWDRARLCSSDQEAAPRCGTRHVRSPPCVPSATGSGGYRRAAAAALRPPRTPAVVRSRW